MLWANLPIVDTINPNSNKFATDVKIKVSGNLLLLLLLQWYDIIIYIDYLAVSFYSRKGTNKKPSGKAMLHPETDEDGVENISENSMNSHRL